MLFEREPSVISIGGTAQLVPNQGHTSVSL